MQAARTFRAYAKINLGLRILRKRTDGYHDIETVLHRVDLYDELNIDPSTSLGLSSSDPNLPGNENNLCLRAASLLRKNLGITPGARISLKKKIPVGSGLGGGSSDAGTVLRELPAFWDVSADGNMLLRLALELGSDVPYFLHDGAALARGRGEVLEYFALSIPYTILLCTPRVHVSTAWAYSLVKPGTREHHSNLKEILLEGLQNPTDLSRHLENDFEPVVFEAYPLIRRIKDLMLQEGAVYASLSGSGSSVFGLFSSTDLLESASAILRSWNCHVFHSPPHFSPPPHSTNEFDNT